MSKNDPPKFRDHLPAPYAPRYLTPAEQARILNNKRP